MISPRASLPALRRSLTTRLLLWTAAFVMLAEVLIYVPSIARFRQTYLRDLMADAHLATLALDAAAGSNAAMSPELVQQLLGHAKVVAVIRYQAGFPRRVALGDVPESVAKVYDFRGETLFGLIWDAFETLAAGGNRAIRVVGLSPQDEAVLLEVFLTDTRLKAEMIAYSWRILVLSVIISLIAASLVYLSLHWLLVRPLRRLTENMAVFRDGPEDTQRLMRPSARGDEIGFAERELRSMQIGLRAALRQRAHLAALGTAVTKINHDLRNALSSAQLVSDRLTDSADPQVRRVAPTLVRSIDRAVDLCTQTLEFARGQEHQLAIEPLDLRVIADEVFQGLAPGFKAATLVNAVPAGFTLQADRVQFERVLINLVRNALQAGALTVTVSAARDGRAVVEVTDDGPGLPPALRERLFEPFATGRKGGIGLGLAIVRDLVEAHGGFVRLLPSERGAHFRIELPRG